MATQDSVQSFIQGLVPLSSNNGNPNTAYNNSSRTVNPFAVQATSPFVTSNSPVPVMDAFGNWQIPSVAPQFVGTDDMFTSGFNIRNFLPTAPLTTRPTTPPIEQPPATTPPGGTVTPPVTPPVGTGGNTPPSSGGTPLNPGGSGGGGTSIMDILSRGGISGVGGLNTGGNFPTSTNFGNPANPIDWRQVLDVLSEPFLPGDVWKSNINQLDVGAGVEGLLQNLTGIPFTGLRKSIPQSVMDKLLEKDPATYNAAERYLVDSYLTNVTNQLQGGLNNIVNRNMGQVSKDTNAAISKTVQDALAKLGMTYTPQGNFQVVGGGGPRSSFLGTNKYGVYGSSQEARDAYETAVGETQNAIRASLAASPKNRQAGADAYGRIYAF